MFAYTLAFNPRSKATNIGYGLFWGAVFWLQGMIVVHFNANKFMNAYYCDIITAIEYQSFKFSFPANHKLLKKPQVLPNIDSDLGTFTN